MPMFEFRCRECGQQFEEIVRGEKIPSCPACESEEVTKLISAFAVGRGGRTSSRRAEAPCPPTGGT